MVLTRSQRIPLSSLQALTLHRNKRTASRRTAPVPQLSCRGKVCRTYEPDVVQCVATGSDGAGGLEWKCEADLPDGIRFGEVQVGCEGWDGPGDTHILRGSCGLEYSLVRSSSSIENSFGTLPSSFKRYAPSSFESAFSTGFNLLFAALTAYLLFSFLHKLARRFFPSIFGGDNDGRPPPPPGSSSRWGGGGGGGGGPSGRPPRPPPPGGPPPPYTPKPPAPAPESQQSWRPGFWTGAAAGWAANALLGSTRPRQDRAYGQGYGEGPYAPLREGGEGGGGFWGGGGQRGGLFGPRRAWGARGGDGGANLREWEDGDRGVGGSGSWGRGGGGGGSGSGGMRSTGFGGTSVR
ncbi:hypothetical protein Rhopal_007268-T1 [Rhodotorula paludigena]|uniref:Store-operated calcium entry-associated regulatory factor n=1 Tax=Rhodotorula paludigena TaxID=86838 RepID=A0AAV5GUH8_9BASI|nr:hypothetical protein Rhopal_007268-T1 [Rhodotorula paludigena]